MDKKYWKKLNKYIFYLILHKVINLERRKYKTSARYNATETGIRKTHFQHPSVVDCSGMMNKIKLVNDCLTSLSIICTQRKKIWDYKHV